MEMISHSDLSNLKIKERIGIPRILSYGKSLIDSQTVNTARLGNCDIECSSVVCLKHPFASMATALANTQCPKQKCQIFSLSLALLLVPCS